MIGCSQPSTPPPEFSPELWQQVEHPPMCLGWLPTALVFLVSA
jgi:hypothetical protein